MIAAGDNHTAAIDSNGYYFCWASPGSSLTAVSGGRGLGVVASRGS